MPATIPTPSINISASSSSSSSSTHRQQQQHPHHQHITTGTPTGGTGSGSSSLTHGYPMLSSSALASSPFNPEALAAATALRRPSLVLSVGSFHSAQLRRPSFFAPFPYGQSPQHQFDSLQDYSSSPRRGDVYQRDLEANYCSNFSCCGLTLGDLHALLQHYEESHVRFEEEDDNGHPVPAGFVDEDGWSTNSDSISNNSHPHGGLGQQQRSHHHLKGSSTLSANAAAAATVAALTAGHQQQQQQQQQQPSQQHHQQQQQDQQQKLTPLSFLNAKKKTTNGVSLSDIYSEDSSGGSASAGGMSMDGVTSSLATSSLSSGQSAFPSSILRTAAQAEFSSLASKKRDLSAFSTSYDTHSPMTKKASNFQNMTLSSATAALNSNQNGAVDTSKRNNNPSGTNINIINTGTQNINNSNGGMTGTMGSIASQEELLSSVTDYLQLAIKQGLLPDCGEVGSASYMQAAEDLIKKREELVSIMESINKTGSSGADKPYRCQVSGCDKAYKNPNGLKYHNQHGHCSASGLADSEGPESKPYMCTFMECGKRYKNLNGLKYHIEHSHPNLTAALRAHQAGLTTHPLLVSGVFANNQAAALTIAAALSAVESSPMMMAAINAITASANNASNNANSNNNTNNNSSGGNGVSGTNNSSGNRLSPPSDHTPDSSPNASPALRPAVPAQVPVTVAPAPPTLASSTLNTYRGGDNNVFSTDVTPMTSPVLSRATLPGLNLLSIQTFATATGLATPSSLSPTSSAAPKSPTGISQVSTLTAALAAVTVEQQRLQQQQHQHPHQQRTVM